MCARSSLRWLALPNILHNNNNKKMNTACSKLLKMSLQGHQSSLNLMPQSMSNVKPLQWRNKRKKKRNKDDGETCHIYTELRARLLCQEKGLHNQHAHVPVSGSCHGIRLGCLDRTGFKGKVGKLARGSKCLALDNQLSSRTLMTHCMLFVARFPSTPVRLIKL